MYIKNPLRLSGVSAHAQLSLYCTYLFTFTLHTYDTSSLLSEASFILAACANNFKLWAASNMTKNLTTLGFSALERAYESEAILSGEYM